MWCFKCKKNTGDKNIESVDGPRARQVAQCEDCGGKKSQFITSQKGKGAIDAELSNKAYDKNAAEEVKGYKLDKELSTDKTRVYVNGSDVKISHRGTVASDKKDLKDDLKIAVGNFSGKTSDRVKEAKNVARATQEKYGDATITNVGHSLGGALAKKAGSVLSVKNSKVESYNSGSSVLELPRNLYNKAKCSVSNSNECKKLKNVTENSTRVDPISFSAAIHAGKTKSVAPSSINVHSISNFKQ